MGGRAPGFTEALSLRCLPLLQEGKQQSAAVSAPQKSNPSDPGALSLLSFTPRSSTAHTPGWPTAASAVFSPLFIHSAVHGCWLLRVQRGRLSLRIIIHLDQLSKETHQTQNCSQSNTPVTNHLAQSPLANWSRTLGPIVPSHQGTQHAQLVHHGCVPLARLSKRACVLWLSPAGSARSPISDSCVTTHAQVV
jgi:hypothetical protein